MSAQRRTENTDRRIIERVSSPLMNTHLRQMRWLLLALTILLGSAAIYNVTSVATAATDVTYGIFLGIIFFAQAFAFWRYYSSVLLFLENESSSNLDRMMERQMILWLSIVFFGVLYAGTFLLFK